MGDRPSIFTIRRAVFVRLAEDSYAKAIFPSLARCKKEKIRNSDKRNGTLAAIGDVCTPRAKTDDRREVLMVVVFISPNQKDNTFFTIFSYNRSTIFLIQSNTPSTATTAKITEDTSSIIS